jgi:putative membrane protein insertion efficiency factor
MRRLAIILLKAYKVTFSRFFELVLGNGCRYNPTCSEYTSEAVQKYGLKKGLSISARRIINCHPFGRRSLFDPVP